MNYYQLWSRRIEQKTAELDSLLEDLERNTENILRESGLAELVYELGVPDLSKYRGIRLGAVDGGEGIEELSGVAIFMIRASGLYTKIGAKVFGDTASGDMRSGDFFRDLDLDIAPIDKYTKARVQFRRATMEFAIATKLAEERNPDYLLIDGSLLVSTEIDPLHISEYQSYIATLRNLFRVCDSNGIQLVGVSEDSASKGLISFLSRKNSLSIDVKKSLANLTDASLIQFYVQKSYLEDCSKSSKDLCIATEAFLPIADKGRDWIKQHTGISKVFPTFYLQTNTFGRALRVDFPLDDVGDDIDMVDWGPVKEKARSLASMLAAMSSKPKNYGYPSPLYIAHCDAELPKRLMDQTSALIQRRVFKKWHREYASMCLKKRRDNRPGDFA